MLGRSLGRALGVSLLLALLPVFLMQTDASGGFSVGCLTTEAALALASPAPQAQAQAAAAATLVDLTAGPWLRDGRPVDEPPALVLESDGPAAVRLPCDAMGRRWATIFETDAPASVRLGLDWRPGPEGLLVEFQLDGQVLPPPRDAWRPSERPLRSDLGPVWLGAGTHRLVIVAREQREDGAVTLAALRLTPP